MSTQVEKQNLDPQGTLDLLIDGRGWMGARWGTWDNNRKARFYTLTKTGREQLVRETTKWMRLSAAMARIQEG